MSAKVCAAAGWTRYCCTHNYSTIIYPHSLWGIGNCSAACSSILASRVRRQNGLLHHAHWLALSGMPNIFVTPALPGFKYDAVFTKEVVEKMVVHAYGRHLGEMAPNQRLADIGSLLLAVEVMWFESLVKDRLGEGVVTQERIRFMPPRARALLDAACNAGLVLGRTLPQVVAALRVQSAHMLQQFQRSNALARVEQNQQPLNELVLMVSDLRRECHELRQVRAHTFPSPTFPSPTFLSLNSVSWQLALQQGAGVERVMGLVQQQQRLPSAAGAVPHGASPPRRVSPAAAGLHDVLRPENFVAEGRDDSGYFVQGKITAVDFILEVVQRRLGRFTAEGFTWGELSQWRSVNGDKLQATRNSEAKFFMELFVFTSTAQERLAIAASIIGDATAQQALVDLRRNAVVAVIARVKEFLDRWEPFRVQNNAKAGRQKKGAAKAGSVNALAKRWQTVGRPRYEPGAGPGAAGANIAQWATVSGGIIGAQVQKRAAEGSGKTDENLKKKRKKQ